MPGSGLARLSIVCPPCPLPLSAALPSLTGPEQHGPVETRGLGGVPWPLTQPLRHAPVRSTAEPALRTGSARGIVLQAGAGAPPQR